VVRNNKFNTLNIAHKLYFQFDFELYNYLSTYSQMISDIAIVKTLVIPWKRLYSLSTHMKEPIKDNSYII
jgi:hypothetical protein